MVTEVPPAIGPEVGLMEVRTGSTWYVNLSAEEVALVPPGVVTVTSASPAAWAGLVAVTCVAETTMTPVAGVPSKLTAVAPVRLVPVMVTLVPPMVLPVVGLTPETVGAGGGVWRRCRQT